MKAVMISIQPKWCELIASGKKTVEVRKTKPKLETPFKCYIYETKDKQFENIGVCGWKADGTAYNYIHNGGKVIGEFVCNAIISHCEMANADIAEIQGCIKREKLLEYSNGKELYGWHISDLVIYDKPKELSEFYQNGKSGDTFYYDYCAGCPHHETPVGEYPCNECDGNRKYLYSPPQSWCYVEERSNR